MIIIKEFWLNGNFNNEKKKFIKLNGDKQKSIRTKKIAQNRCFGYVSFFWRKTTNKIESMNCLQMILPTKWEKHSNQTEKKEEDHSGQFIYIVNMGR